MLKLGTGRYGGGHYSGGRYGGGRYGGAFQFRVDATAEPPDTHITKDATAGWGSEVASLAVPSSAVVT